MINNKNVNTIATIKFKEIAFRLVITMYRIHNKKNRCPKNKLKPEVIGMYIESKNAIYVELLFTWVFIDACFKI
jgi:hypothetical protein